MSIVLKIVLIVYVGLFVLLIASALIFDLWCDSIDKQINHLDYWRDSIKAELKILDAAVALRDETLFWYDLSDIIMEYDKDDAMKLISAGNVIGECYLWMRDCAYEVV